MTIEGEEKDRIVVVGDGVDSATLTHCLRKKVGHANLVSIEEVKPKEKEEKKEKDDKPKSSMDYLLSRTTTFYYYNRLSRTTYLLHHVI